MGPKPDPVEEEFYLSYLARGPSQFGERPRRSETSTDPPDRDHRRAYRAKSKDDVTGECALASLKTTVIANKG